MTELKSRLHKLDFDGKIVVRPAHSLVQLRTQRKDNDGAAPRHLNDGLVKGLEGQSELCKQQFCNWSDYDGRAASYRASQ